MTYVPFYFVLGGTLLGFCTGAMVMWSLGREDREIVAALRHAKDAGELQDVKDQADE